MGVPCKPRDCAGSLWDQTGLTAGTYQGLLWAGTGFPLGEMGEQALGAPWGSRVCLPQQTVLEAGKPTPILVLLLTCPSDPKEDDDCRCSSASCSPLGPPQDKAAPAELGMSLSLTRPEAMQGICLLGRPLPLLGASPMRRQVKGTALTAVAEREVKETHSWQTDGVFSRLDGCIKLVWPSRAVLKCLQHTAGGQGSWVWHHHAAWALWALPGGTSALALPSSCGHGPSLLPASVSPLSNKTPLVLTAQVLATFR